MKVMQFIAGRKARGVRKQHFLALFTIVVGFGGPVKHGTALADETTSSESEMLTDRAWLPGNMTPGVRMKIQEVGRRTHRRYTEIDTQLVVENAPTEKKYNLWLWSLAMLVKKLEPVPLRGASQPPVDFTVNDSGNWEPRLPTFTIDRYRRGEWFELRLLSTDGLIRAMDRFYPFPIEAEHLGCKVWLALVSDNGEAFAIFGEGFEPGEEVKTTSISNGEVLHGKKVVESDGTLYPSYLFPAARRRNHEASYEIAGRACRVVVEYEWGRPAIQIQ